ncbi:MULTISPECIES: hypothetical protein [unclassified Hwanghaeella]|uniref:hypothetical protein n=1 Tax=unclassified Hwanghaeella TaxID=2605944 RepID=UPI003B66DEA0
MESSFHYTWQEISSTDRFLQWRITFPKVGCVARRRNGVWGKLGHQMPPAP